MIDARALNEGKAGGSENFLALQQIVNSPGVVELNMSADAARIRTKAGIESVSLSEEVPGLAAVGSGSAAPGMSQVFVARGLDPSLAARVVAHELRHARRFLLGQTPGLELDRDGNRLPDGAANRETNRAADEASRNQQREQ